MAQIDIKEATIKFYDGTLGTGTLDSTPADSDLAFTAATTHIGTDQITVSTVLASGASQPLAISVTGNEITITLATNATSTNDNAANTATLVKTAIDGNASAAALVTVALETAGAGAVEEGLSVTLSASNSISIKIGEGNLTFSEKRAVEFTRDRGILDTVREADEDPMDLAFDILWEFITAETGSGTPTPMDALKQIGEASGWVTTADDPCQPYCLDVEVHQAPNCATEDDEILIFEEFYYESLDGDLRGGTIACTGRCNRKTATVSRVPVADIP